MVFISMFNPNMKPKDKAVLLLTATLCTILVIATFGSVILGHDTGGKMEELIAFILGSITTIIGEYILLQLKLGRRDDDEDVVNKDDEEEYM